MAKTSAKAKTAYELLERVCAHIKAKPQTYLQERFIATGDQAHEYGLHPPCGTAACRAGWIVALHDGPLDPRDYGGIQTRANAILGLDSQTTGDLFSGAALNCGLDAIDFMVKPGTAAYVRAGVRGLRSFMKRHAAHLKARKLDGV